MKKLIIASLIFACSALAQVTVGPGLVANGPTTGQRITLSCPPPGIPCFPQLNSAYIGTQNTLGNLSFFSLAAPATVPTLATGSSGVLTGTYLYRVIFVNRYGGLTDAGALSASIAPSAQQVVLSAVPTGPSGTTARILLRTTSGGSTAVSQMRIVPNPSNSALPATIQNNSVTVFTDNSADSALLPYANNINTTGGALLNNGTVTYDSYISSTGSRVTAIGPGTVATAPGVWIGRPGDIAYVGSLAVIAQSPTGLTGTPSTASGTRPAGTYYGIACTDDSPTRDTCGAESSPVILSATGHIDWVWSVAPGSGLATVYKIFIGTSPGAENLSQAVFNNGASVTDTGSNFATSAAPNTAIPAQSLYVNSNTLNTTYLFGAFNGLTLGRTFSQAVLTIASASTIAPASPIVNLTGTTAVNTITPPTNCTTSAIDCTVSFLIDVATGPATFGTSGNVYVAGSPAIGTFYDLTYNPATSKWYAHR